VDSRLSAVITISCRLWPTSDAGDCELSDWEYVGELARLVAPISRKILDLIDPKRMQHCIRVGHVAEVPRSELNIGDTIYLSSPLIDPLTVEVNGSKIGQSPIAAV
jgi:hypothetical protein